MKRNVFFSFQYDHLFRVKQIRHITNVVARSSAGFTDTSLWESTKNDETKIKRMIDDALDGTCVTVVCITNGIEDREWLDYELDASLERGNGLVGIHLNTIYDPDCPDDRLGVTPHQIIENGFQTYSYSNVERLRFHIDEAAKLARRSSPGVMKELPMTAAVPETFSFRELFNGMSKTR